MRLALMFWIGIGAVLAGAGESEHVYTVCELLAKPEQFNGKLLKVRGIVEGGMEGAWLKSDDCPNRFHIGENSLPNAISLSYQSEHGTAPPRNAVHIKQIEQQIRGKQRKTSVLILTYTGIFETRTDWKIVTSGNGEKHLWGFGHLNAFPAQLVVADIADPQIIAKKEEERK
jgi:hypothetical protein